MMIYAEKIICSFIASFGLAVVFRIDRRCLIFAGLGGALTRLVYLILLDSINVTFVTSFLAAICASLYAELMAMREKMPSTVFLYPGILPLIPGDLLYYIAMSVMMGDLSSTLSYLWQCVLSLGGICMGFVIISTFTYYRKIYFLGSHLHALMRQSIGSVVRCIRGIKK